MRTTHMLLFSPFFNISLHVSHRGLRLNPGEHMQPVLLFLGSPRVGSIGEMRVGADPRVCLVMRRKQLRTAEQHEEQVHPLACPVPSVALPPPSLRMHVRVLVGRGPLGMRL